MAGNRFGKAVKRVWDFFWRPSAKWPLGAILLGGIAVGALALGGYNEAVVQTNKMSFCNSCHEMREYVYVDYTQSVHYKNPVGVRAECKDCHEPAAWGPQFVAKVKSVNDLYNHLAGTIATRQAFEKHRQELDKRVWAEMKANDSRNCRKCHSWNAMLTQAQIPAARASHAMGLKAGFTCIDCHKGIMRMKGNFQATSTAGKSGL